MIDWFKRKRDVMHVVAFILIIYCGVLAVGPWKDKELINIFLPAALGILTQVRKVEDDAG